MKDQATCNVSSEESQEAMDMPGTGYKIKGRESTIFRVVKNKDNPYVMIDRRPVDNPKLSFKAKGILTYLLSRPDGWEVNIPDLANHGTDGKSSIRAGLKELRNAHHVAYNPTRHLTGRYITKWVIEVYEIPYGDPIDMEHEAQAETDLDDDFSNVGQNLHAGNLHVGNRTQVLSTLSTTEINKRDSDSEIFTKLSELTGGGLNSNTPKFVDAWLERHTPARILEAIQISKTNKARSTKYVDEILLSWEANGYPKTREERVAERKAKQPPSAYQQIKNILAEQKAERELSNVNA